MACIVKVVLTVAHLERRQFTIFLSPVIVAQFFDILVRLPLSKGDPELSMPFVATPLLCFSGQVMVFCSIDFLPFFFF